MQVYLKAQMVTNMSPTKRLNKLPFGAVNSRQPNKSYNRWGVWIASWGGALLRGSYYDITGGG